MTIQESGLTRTVRECIEQQCLIPAQSHRAVAVLHKVRNLVFVLINRHYTTKEAL